MKPQRELLLVIAVIAVSLAVASVPVGLSFYRHHLFVASAKQELHALDAQMQFVRVDGRLCVQFAGEKATCP